MMLIGNAYWYLNQFESAMKYYTRASVIGYALNDTILIISGMNAKGTVYGNTGQRDSALILFKEANDLATQINNREQVILTYYNMGDVALYSGRVDDALGISLCPAAKLRLSWQAAVQPKPENAGLYIK